MNFSLGPDYLFDEPQTLLWWYTLDQHAQGHTGTRIQRLG